MKEGVYKIVNKSGQHEFTLTRMEYAHAAYTLLDGISRGENLDDTMNEIKKMTGLNGNLKDLLVNHFIHCNYIQDIQGQHYVTPHGLDHHTMIHSYLMHHKEKK